MQHFHLYTFLFTFLLAENSCAQSPCPCAGDNGREDRRQDKALCSAVREYALLSLLHSPLSPLSLLSSASVLTSTLLRGV